MGNFLIFPTPHLILYKCKRLFLIVRTILFLVDIIYRVCNASSLQFLKKITSFSWMRIWDRRKPVFSNAHEIIAHSGTRCKGTIVEKWITYLTGHNPFLRNELLKFIQRVIMTRSISCWAFLLYPFDCSDCRAEMQVSFFFADAGLVEPERATAHKVNG